MNKPIAIIIHCSATPVFRDFSLMDIDRMHRNRGFASVGYHYYITKDGVVHQGRPINQVGAHCIGWNDQSIGICYEGGLNTALKSEDTRTSFQKSALTSLIRDLITKYPLITKIYPHSKFANKDCPCFDAEKEYSYLLKYKSDGLLK